jgi:hypothetical protein
MKLFDNITYWFFQTFSLAASCLLIIHAWFTPDFLSPTMFFWAKFVLGAGLIGRVAFICIDRLIVKSRRERPYP